MNNITEDFPQLTVKLLDNGNLRLEDPSYSEGAIVDIHPAQLRLMAEKIGLIEAPQLASEKKVETVSTFPTLHEQARTIDRLQRNMLRLRSHALYLQDEMRKGDWGNADLVFEMMLVNGLVDLCDMAVDDFADDYHAREPAGLPTGSDRVSSGLPVGSPRVSKTGANSGIDHSRPVTDAPTQLEIAA